VDEVLGVQGNEPWDEIQGRWQDLQELAGRWERHPTDADLQRLGQQVLKRIQEVRDYFKEETAFRCFVEDQQRKRLEKRYSDRLDELVRQDRALQVDEWKTLVRQAVEDGLDESQLQALVEEFAEQRPDVLIGIKIGDRRCMTPDEVRDLWDREGPARMAQVDREQMARWIEICVGDKEKAEQWRQGQIAHVFWGWDSQVCWLGDRPLRTLDDWVEGVYRGDLEKESLDRMDLIADWLEVVHRRGEWAGRLRQAGNLVDEKERRWVLWQVLWATGKRPDPAVAYEGTARLLQVDPEFLEARYWHSIHCVQTQQYDEALGHLRSLLEKADPKGEIYEYLGRLTRMQEEFPDFWPQVQELLNEARFVGQHVLYCPVPGCECSFAYRDPHSQYCSKSGKPLVEPSVTLWVDKFVRPSLENDLLTTLDRRADLLARARGLKLQEAEAERAFADEVKRLTGVTDDILKEWIEAAVRPALAREVVGEEDRSRLIEEAVQKGIGRDVAQGIIKRVLPLLEIDTPQIDLGSVKVGTKLSRQITVTNAGGGRLRGVVRSSGDWITVSPARLDPGTSKQNIEVRVDTSRLRVGMRHSGELTFETSGGIRSLPVRVTVRRSLGWSLLIALVVALGGIAALVLFSLRPAPPLEVTLKAEPTTVPRGGRVQLYVLVHRAGAGSLTYSWTTTGGRIEGSGPEVELDTSDVPATNRDVRLIVSVRVEDSQGTIASSQQAIVVKPHAPSPQPGGAVRSTPSAPPPTAPRIEEGAPAWASVVLTANVEGVSVSVDGESVGEVSHGQQRVIRLPAGRHRIRATKVGYEVWEREVDIALNSRNLISIVLKPLPNHPPSVVLSADREQINWGESVQLFANANDPDGDEIRYSWSTTHGDLQGEGPVVTLRTSGMTMSSELVRVTVTVTVSDPRGGSSSDSRTLIVRSAPAVTTWREGRYLFVSIAGASEGAMRSAGAIDVELSMADNVGKVTGFLPGAPCRVDFVPLENVAEYSFREPPGDRNRWRRVVVRVRPRDPKQAIRFRIHWRLIQSTPGQ
jgi:tetratricopeptide (TPR) repeat protein